MSHLNFNNLHILGRVTILEDLSKEYLDSVADFENTKINSGTILSGAQESNSDDDTFSDCIYLN